MSVSESKLSQISEDPAPIYFDSYALVGPRGKKDPRELWRTEDLISEMEHCGIHGALISHRLAREYDPVYANRLLLQELKKSDGLFGCWVLLPDHLGEMAEPSVLVQEMRSEGIVAGKLYPKTHRFELDERTCGGLLDALEGEGLPLLVDIEEAELSAIARICERHPRLAVLLQRFRHGRERLLLPLMDSYESLYVEFSSNQANYVIERLVDRYGPERLLFGTESPIKSPGAAKAMIDYADIGEDARALIGGGNLARLLGVEPPQERIPVAADDDRVLTAVRAGRPVTELIPDADIIDAHTHSVHKDGLGVGLATMPRGDIDWMLKSYDCMGIAVACVAPWLGVFSDTERGNDIAFDAVERHPDRAVGYATLNPNYVDDVAAEIRRIYKHPGMKGLKFHYRRTGVEYDDPRYRPWWEYANTHRLVALVNAAPMAPRKVSRPGFGGVLRELAEAYPDISFLLPHTAGAFETIRDFTGIALDIPNVYFEITLTDVPLGSMELLTEIVGADRVIFGTDSPMRDPRPQFGWVAYAHLSEEDKLKILGGNMRRILDRCR